MNDPETRLAGPPSAPELEREVAALRAELAALRGEHARREEDHRCARAELQQRLEQLHGIYQLSEAASHAEDLETIYGEALRCLTETLGAHRAAVLLFDEGGRMRFKAQTGLSERYRAQVDGHSPWSRDSRDPAPILIPDAAADGSLGPLRETLAEERIAALGFLPLINHGRLLGKLMIYYDRPHAFDEKQLELAQTIAAHIASAIDRKQREEALAGARERLGAVISSSPIILFAADERGVVTLSEGRGLEQLGVPPGSLVGMSVEVLCQGNPQFHDYVRRAMGGETFAAVIEAHGSSFEARCAPLRDEGGRPRGMIGVATDITERRRAEDALAFLADASTQLAASLDYPTTLSTVGRIFVPRLSDWCAVYVVEGERLRKVSVCHPDESLHDMIQLMHQRVPPGLYPGHPVMRVMAGGGTLLFQDLSDEELRAMCLDEEHFQQLLRLGARTRLCLPMQCRGRTLGAIVLNRTARGSRYDAEEIRRAEELAWRCAMAIDNARLYHETQEAVRAREEFLSIASHEIRAPLNTLHLQVQLLCRSLLRNRPQPPAGETDRVATMLEGADRQVRRLTELIDKLFDVSRIAAGKLELRPEEVDLAQLVRDTVTHSAVELQQVGCEVALSAPQSCVGRWDRVRLDQVVTNLLENAMKYGAGKPISLRVEGTGRLARLVVSDQGIGIAADRQEQIFERFERAASRGYGGLGLGLYIVRKILHAMGGTIRVDSQLGVGSTFVVELPTEQAAQQAQQQQQQQSLPPSETSGRASVS